MADAVSAIALTAVSSLIRHQVGLVEIRPFRRARENPLPLRRELGFSVPRLRESGFRKPNVFVCHPLWVRLTCGFSADSLHNPCAPLLPGLRRDALALSTACGVPQFQLPQRTPGQTRQARGPMRPLSVANTQQVCYCAPPARLLHRRLLPKGRAPPRRQGLRVTGGPSFSHERGLARRLISAFSRSFPPDNPLPLWV